MEKRFRLSVPAHYIKRLHVDADDDHTTIDIVWDAGGDYDLETEEGVEAQRSYEDGPLDDLYPEDMTGEVDDEITDEDYENVEPPLALRIAPPAMCPLCGDPIPPETTSESIQPPAHTYCYAIHDSGAEMLREGDLVGVICGPHKGDVGTITRALAIPERGPRSFQLSTGQVEYGYALKLNPGKTARRFRNDG